MQQRPVAGPGMIAAGYLPLVLIGSGVAVLWWLRPPASVGILLALGWTYLLPPLTCRALIEIFGRPVTEGAGPQDRVFRLWWVLTQLQMPFNRIGLLEELLKLVPGLYPLWLGLWGSWVSPMAFFAREVLIADRYLVTIGAGAVFGSYSGLSPHLLDRGPDGRMRLVVAPVEIGAGAVIGIGAGAGPGCRVAAGATLPAGRRLRPFTLWDPGKRLNPQMNADQPRFGS